MKSKKQIDKFSVRKGHHPKVRRTKRHESSIIYRRNRMSLEDYLDLTENDSKTMEEILNEKST